MTIYAFGVYHITWWIPSSKIETIFTNLLNFNSKNGYQEEGLLFLYSSVNLV